MPVARVRSSRTPRSRVESSGEYHEWWAAERKRTVPRAPRLRGAFLAVLVPGVGGGALGEVAAVLISLPEAARSWGRVGEVAREAGRFSIDVAADRRDQVPVGDVSERPGARAAEGAARSPGSFARGVAGGGVRGEAESIKKWGPSHYLVSAHPRRNSATDRTPTWDRKLPHGVLCFPPLQLPRAHALAGRVAGHSTDAARSASPSAAGATDRPGTAMDTGETAYARRTVRSSPQPGTAQQKPLANKVVQQKGQDTLHRATLTPEGSHW